MGENLFARCVRLILQRAGRTELGSRGRLGAGGMALGGQCGGAGAVDQALGLGALPFLPVVTVPVVPTGVLLVVVVVPSFWVSTVVEGNTLLFADDLFNVLWSWILPPLWRCQIWSLYFPC